ncbi:D-sedoheptulose 7-phosphate isomerase [bacterium]|jgi:D-sedoheptulose 7-phosphate isomerase|nr:D-sedoheptulose 7-phosphate isomerase [bacterium]
MLENSSSQSALNGLAEAGKILQEFLSQEDLGTKFELAVEILVNAFEKELPVLSCGNGGSTCDAMHFAEEFTGRYRKNRRPLPALSISDPSHLTCVANDFGYEDVFSRQVDAFGKEGGALLAISTSGNSKNILKAIQAAQVKKVKVIGLSGPTGGEMLNGCDVCFQVPTKKTERIQEVHIKIIHNLIEAVERHLFPELY